MHNALRILNEVVQIIVKAVKLCCNKWHHFRDKITGKKWMSKLILFCIQPDHLTSHYMNTMHYH